MHLFRPALVAAISIAALSLTAAAPFRCANTSQDDMDRSIKPGDDFYRFANGGWLRTVTIPAGQSSYDTRAS